MARLLCAATTDLTLGAPRGLSCFSSARLPKLAPHSRCCDVFELDSGAHGCHGNLCARGYAEYAKDCADVYFDRPFRQTQFSTDALVRQAQHHESEDAALALTEAQMASIAVLAMGLRRSSVSAWFSCAALGECRLSVDQAVPGTKG